MPSNSQQSTSESITSPNYTNGLVTTEAVTAIINDAIRTNDSFAATLSRPQLVALSNQTEIREHSTKDVEINDSHPETDLITIKEEDKDDSESTPTPKRVNPLSPTEPTELPRMVPGMVQRTEAIFTGAISIGAERLHGIQTPNKPTRHDRPEDLSHRLTLRSNSGIQLPTDYRQPLLELPVAGSENFHLPYRDLTTYQHFLDRIAQINNYAQFDIDTLTRQRLAVLWRLLSYPSLAAALVHGAREVYNYQAANLIQIFGNHISLRWQDKTALRIGGNIDQMTIDILRCTLKADVERYYSKAIMGLEEHLYQVTTHINDARMVIQSPATFTPKRSMPNRRWSMDFINDTIQTLGDMHQSIADIAENIRSIHTCAEKINGTNPEGIPEYQFTERQVRRINLTIEALDQGMDEDPANH